MGDAGAPAELEPGVEQDGGFLPLADGDALPLVTPPQGGHVSFVAARLRNVDPCGVKLRAVVRNARTSSIAGEETRTIDFAARLDDAGWAYADLTEIANAANVATCPDYFEDDVVDAESRLEVTATDRAGRVASATRMVFPRCTQADEGERALCRCECSANYTLGRCADPVDGGWLDGGPEAAP